MVARILISDCMAEGKGRFKCGEEGEVLINDSAKYDYKIELKGTQRIEIAGKVIECPRIFYFYKDEIKILE